MKGFTGIRVKRTASVMNPIQPTTVSAMLTFILIKSSCYFHLAALRTTSEDTRSK